MQKRYVFFEICGRLDSGTTFNQIFIDLEPSGPLEYTAHGSKFEGFPFFRTRHEKTLNGTP